MEIKILGSGCSNCKRLHEAVLKAQKETGTDAQVIYVTDIEEIVKTGLMSTPGLMINGSIKSMGRVPKQKEIKQMIADEKRRLEPIV